MQKPNQCKGCPYEKSGHSFVPGHLGDKPLWRLDAKRNIHRTNIDFSKVRLSVCGEGPAYDEALKGYPFAGRAGSLMNHWIFDETGIDRSKVVIDNVVRCDAVEPDKPINKDAVDFCVQYDRHREFQPELDILTLHPAALLRDIVPLPLVQADFGKARELSRDFRVRLLLGKSAIQKWYRFASNPTRWRGHVIKA